MTILTLLTMGCNKDVTPRASKEAAQLSRLPLEEIARSAQEHASDASYLYEASRRLNEAGRFNEAGPLLTHAVQLAPEDTKIREELIRAQVAVGRLSEAYSQLKQFSDARPTSAEGHRLLGNLHVAVGVEHDALTELEKATQLDPNSGPAWRDLAVAREKFRNAASAGKALEAAERAVTLLPKDPVALLVNARLLGRMRRPEARDLYERSLQADPSRPDARRQFAEWLLDNSGSEADNKRAAEEARKSLEQDPRSPLAHLSLGMALARLGDTSGAVAPLQEAARLAPNAPQPALELSRALASSGRETEAATWRREAGKRQAYRDELQKTFSELTTRPTDRKLLARMARLNGTHGEISEAVRYRAMALDAAPDSPEVLRATAKDLREGGYTKAAEVLLKRATALGNRAR